EARPAALLPWIEADEKESVVGRGNVREQAESADGRVSANALRLMENVLDLAADDIGPLQRCRVGQLDVEEEVALLLIGDEAARQFSPEEAGKKRESGEDCQGQHRFADQQTGEADVAAPDLLESAIERPEKSSDL